MAKEPSYCHHKGTNQAYIRLAGKVHYLGPYDSPESKERYRRLKGEWLLNPEAFEIRKQAPSDGPTMAELCLAYLEFARSYYAGTKESEHFRRAIQAISELYATLPAAEFGAVEFKACITWLNDGSRSRSFINAQAKRLRRMVKWGVSEKLVPVTVHQELECVALLKRGKSQARETEPVKPVPAGVVEKTIAAMPPVVADMVRLQLLLGCRPGELCKLRPKHVDRSAGEVWEIRLSEHKTAHHGHERTIYVGPKAQAILAKYLLRDQDTPCFSPAEADRQRYKGKPGRRTAGDEYDTSSYGKAIAYGCRRAFPPPKEIRSDAKAVKAWHVAHRWSPNQLRHSRATEVRKLYGLEAAASVLGHSEVGVTQIYAEQDRERAVQVAREVG